MINFKSHFNFNKRERNGIFFLIVLIISIQVAYFFVDFSSDVDPILKNEILKIENKKQNNKDIKETSAHKIFPFNPNYLTDFKAYQLGLSVEEIDRLLAFRASGKFINSAQEFQNITKINDSLFAIIQPVLKFPDWVKKQSIKNGNNTSNVTSKILDLNGANQQDLELINGIGPTFAKRIIDYRSKLNGFSTNDQLFEVWNLEKEVVEKVLNKFQVLSIPKITKLNVNTASFKELLKTPYLDYELTKKIVNYRVEVAEIQSIEELKKIEGFPANKFSRIALYLEAK